MTQAQAEDTRIDWEAALVQRACTGDTRAFERLYREHAGRVYGLCLRMTRDGGALEWTLETPVEVREIEAAIGTLPDGARDALVLHALYGYSHGEAAQMLGVAEGTCKAQLHRARKLLRERLNMEVG
jgi:DNA-directed RNA polymerase specialized sigma24 family protein